MEQSDLDTTGQSVFPSVLFDEAHSEAWSVRPEAAAEMNPHHPADASYLSAADALRRRGMRVTPHVNGFLTPAALAGHDVLVLAHPSDGTWERVTGIGSPMLTVGELDAVESFVRSGGGLVVLAECEQDKYGNNLADLLSRFGVHPRHLTVQDTTRNHKDVVAWVRAELPTQSGSDDLLARVAAACFYRSGALAVTNAEAVVLARTSLAADPADEPLAVALPAGLGRVVVFADSDLFGDDSIGDYDHVSLWSNIVMWAGSGATVRESLDVPSATREDPAWVELKVAVRQIRVLQQKDGSLTDEADRPWAATLVARCVEAVVALRQHFLYDAPYLDALVHDLRRWVDEGFGVPDFLDSLMAFRPELQRVDGREHLVVFPMYTQNGNPNRNLEAAIIRVVWPQWLADLEATRYDNAKFVPIAFVDFTEGYDTHSAVLFPETVAVREIPTFTWGGIFCDREAARFRRVTAAAVEVLQLGLPPAAARLVHHQQLAQNTFVLWDLIHDRTHSRGDLPFDPFMIKQRMPYWMYALEELRCDLQAFRQAVELEAAGTTPYGEIVQYAVLFDRLFRFPITGERVRNYDGLGGQLLFAYLHKAGVLHWTDNRLSLDWPQVPAAVLALEAEVEKLYRDGIDRSRVAHWIAGHEFLSRYVAADPRSVWARGAVALPLSGPPKDLVDLVMPDEFPLNVFYEALRRKLAAVVESARGITGTAATATSASPTSATGPRATAAVVSATSARVTA
ncbi:MAG: hypothetical protein QOG52_388 [Frankiaceae bacterium]|nr:hypothetical protein [Frankiaceae bacterium]